MDKLTPIGELTLSTRTCNCLERAQIKTLQDLTSYESSELLGIRGFGPFCLEEIRREMKSRGLSLLNENTEAKPEAEEPLTETQTRFLETFTAYLGDLAREPDVTTQETIKALELAALYFRRSRPEGKMTPFAFAVFGPQSLLPERRKLVAFLQPPDMP